MPGLKSWSRPLLASLAGLGLAVSVGCSNRLLDDGLGAGDESTGDGGSTGGGDDADAGTPPVTTMGPATTMGPVTTMGPAPGETGEPPDPSGPAPEPTTVSATADGGPPPGDLPDGSQCSDDSECQSLNCYVLGALGGICGECNEDADCPSGGCSLPNPLTSEPSLCNDGEVAAGCESDDACGGGLICADILDVPGVLVASTCSECDDDSQCPPGWLCNPSYDIASITGVKLCRAAGTVGDGEGCEPFGDGDAACASGRCAVASFMDLFELGVCSECSSGADCMSGVCDPAEIDLAKGFIPATCV